MKTSTRLFLLMALTGLANAQKAPEVSELDPAMGINKAAAGNLDWHDVTGWGVEGRILPEQQRERWFYGDDTEGATDASHASDLGFMRQADIFEPVLRRVLGR
jgi:hypothetical protein